jgi:hypothetical protein
MRKSLRVVMAVALLVAALVALQSGEQGSPALFRPAAMHRSAPAPKAHFVSPAKQDVAEFELAGNSRGDATLMWRQWARFGHTRLWVRTKRAGGSFGRPHALTGVHVSAVEAQAAVGEDGTQLVTWLELDRGKTSLKAAARRDDGSFAKRTLSSQRTPASTIYTGTAMDLALAADGTALLVGVGYFHGASQVFALERNANGHWSKPEVVTSGKRGVRYPTVAFDGAGAATLAWERGEREFPDDGAPRVKQEIRVAVRPPGGRFGKPRRVSKPAEDARDASLAVDARGDAALMWNATHGRNLPGSRIGIALRRAGGQFGAPHLITPPGEAFLPRAAIGPGGSVVAVWTDRDTVVSARGSIGEGLGDAQSLSSRGVEADSVAASSGGDAFATWLRFGRGREDFESRVEGRFAASDGSLGPVVRLTGRGNHDYPQALLYPDGTALVAWTRLRHARNRIEAVRLRVG